jgi:hypothetical protein
MNRYACKVRMQGKHAREACKISKVSIISKASMHIAQASMHRQGRLGRE